MKTKHLFIPLTLGLGLALALLWLTGGGLCTARADATPIHYVSITGSDSGTCASSASPCRTVQYAVDQAGAGDEVRVATGVFTGVQARTGITQMVYISKNVTIRGGYTTTNWLTPDPDAYPTVLDAQGQGRVLVITDTITSTLEGLHITGGDALGLEGCPTALGPTDCGGGVFIYTATAIISNCRIYTNSAWFGGGVQVTWSRSSTLAHNTFEYNTAGGSGGGLYLLATDATVNHNTFRNNDATIFWGGGIQAEGYAPVLTGNIITGNTAKQHGGGLSLISSFASLYDNVIQNNTAITDGGGIYILGESHWDSVPGLKGNLIQTNTALYGGGILVQGSVPILTANVIQGNTATDKGGGIYLDNSGLVVNSSAGKGALALPFPSPSNGAGPEAHYQGRVRQARIGTPPTALAICSVPPPSPPQRLSTTSIAGTEAITAGTVVRNNTAYDYGGGLILDHNSTAILGSLVVIDNHLTASNGSGSGIDILRGSEANLYHSTIVGNDGGNGSGIFVEANSTAWLTNAIIASHTVGISVNSSGSVSLTATLWHSNTARWSGNGSLNHSSDYSGDPAFTADGYHVMTTSAAIDRGLPTPFTVDIDGQIRKGQPDLGADECYVNQAPTADAGPPQTVHAAATVTLDGSGSNDPNCDTLTYHWAQIGGTPVTLSAATAVSPTFLAPAAPGVLTFTLTVSDPLGLSDVDVTRVTVTEGDHSVYLPLMLRNGQSSSQITALPTGMPLPSSAAPMQALGVISPTSSFVLYHREDDNTIWLKTPLSHTQIMTGTLQRLSPDGRYLVYQTELWDGDYYVRDLQTGQDTMIFDVQDNSVGASWTDDGGHIVFDHGCDIYRIKPDGSGLETLISGWPNAYYGCWNDWPDSNPVDGRIAWENGWYGLGLADADGGNPHWIPNTQSDDYDPRWSPDGQWIAFWRDENLYKIKPDGSGLTQLTFLTASGDKVKDSGPWTPDGRYQVVAAIVNGRKGLYAVPTDGSGQFLLLVARTWQEGDWVGNAGDLEGLLRTIYLPLALRNR